jgi:hypothetical protein
MEKENKANTYVFFQLIGIFFYFQFLFLFVFQLMSFYPFSFLKFCSEMKKKIIIIKKKKRKKFLSTHVLDHLQQLSYKSTSSRFPTIFHIFREQNYFLLLNKKIPHNRSPYIFLYQLNIIFYSCFIFFLSFLLFLSSLYQLIIHLLY